jgi:hypothetical protein
MPVGKRAGFALLALVAFVPPSAGGAVGIGRGQFGVGLNTPGIGARYFIVNDLSLEARGQLEKGVTVVGMRACKYITAGAVLPYAGIEGDYVSFKGDLSSGSGFGGEVLLGLEYFVARRFSVQFDFGPAYLALKENKYSLSASGIEFIVNFGVNYYFGR